MKKYKLPIERDELWKGCMFTSIAHAIMTAHYPDFSHESSWDGMNYNIQNSEGARGTVTFHPECIVAAFQDMDSEREVEEAISYFEGAGEKVKEIAEEETLQYLLEDIDGEMKPFVTAAFWEENGIMYSVDSLDEVEVHSGCLLEAQLMRIEEAEEFLEENYEMNESQLKLLRIVYERKIENPNEQIVLSKDEVEMIGAEDEEALAESKTSFEEMNITWG
ncbi:hypothetical protein BAMA_05340 [Bacillus manliponensis]|uniref:Uncharacterized protein n=1 Tax=Bacillus manliponensis TaxID=574376 RepID=A0A073JW80_9BACI|nr:hypothetical protein [Bacillus manliponensis]KEK18447.1 hypothetical protein BAMA_05340 [Bacillus manliponensis]